MTARRRPGTKGVAILEFSLIGIGLIFVVISFFEIARGMWTFHTMAYAVREGARYAAVHGRNCAAPATCQVTVSQIAAVVKSAGPGLDPDNTVLTLTPAAGSATSDTITNLLGNTATDWPPVSAYAPGQTVKISATYPFRTFLALFWMGQRTLNDSQTFQLGASSTELIQF